MNRHRIRRLIIALALIAVAVTAWFVERPRFVTIPINGRITLDDTPLGDAAFNAERLSADFQATLIPGQFKVEATGGHYTLEVPAGATVAGNLDIRFTDRGQEGATHWVSVQAEPSQLTFTPPVRVVTSNGMSADLSVVSANSDGATLSVAPLVGQSVANWIANRVWSGDGSVPGTKISPVSDVTVFSARVKLRDGGRLRSRGTERDPAFELGIGSKSEVIVRDLTVDRVGSIAAGRLFVQITVGRDSIFREKGVNVRSNEGKLSGHFNVSRMGGKTRVEMTDTGSTSIRLNNARVDFGHGTPELLAEKFSADLDQAIWEQQSGAPGSISFQGRVEVNSITSSDAPFAGMRMESVTATTSTGVDGIELKSMRALVPKSTATEIAIAAMPKAFPLEDQLVAPNVLDLFHDVKLAHLEFEPREFKPEFQDGLIVISCSPLIKGRITALGRHDVISMRTQQVGPFKASVPYLEVNWVPRIDLPFAVPLGFNGHSTWEIVPGGTLADARLKINTTCESVTIGEPTIEGLPAPIKPLVRVASRFRNDVRVGGKSLPDHIKNLATREVMVPLFGPSPDERFVRLLERVEMHSVMITDAGDSLEVVASITMRHPQ